MCRDCAPTSLCALCEALLARARGASSAPAPREDSERSFQARLLREARRFGWLAFHDQDSRGNAVGFPDTWLAKAGQPLLAFELKIGARKPTLAQIQWLETLARAEGVHAALVRPNEWADVLSLLTRRAIRQPQGTVSLPCPWCVGVVLDRHVSPQGQLHVCCRSCGAEGPLALTAEEAQRLWNARAVIPS